MNNINLLITFVSRRYAVVLLSSLPSQTMRERKCLLTTTFSWPLSALTSKRRCFILAHNIRPKFGRTFGTRSVSLPKPSASAECYNLTFGPSLIRCVASHCITEFFRCAQRCIALPKGHWYSPRHRLSQKRLFHSL